jgi:hypothetical protein
LTPIKAYGHEDVPEHLYDELSARFEGPETKENEEEEEEEGQYDDVDSEDEDPMKKYTKTIGSVPGAVFVTSEGRILNAQSVATWQGGQDSDEPGNLLKQVKSRALEHPEPEDEDLDPEIMEALEKMDEEKFEGFDDDFVQELLKGEGDVDGHFEEVGGAYGLDDLEDDDFGKKPLKPGKQLAMVDSEEFYSSDEYDDDDDEIPVSKPRAPKLVDEMFEAALERFDEGKIYFPSSLPGPPPAVCSFLTFLQMIPLISNPTIPPSWVLQRPPRLMTSSTNFCTITPRSSSTSSMHFLISLCCERRTKLRRIFLLWSQLRVCHKSFLIPFAPFLLFWRSPVLLLLCLLPIN